VILKRSRGAITVARVHTIDIDVAWRWVPVLALGTWLLAVNVLPARFPLWEVSTTWLTAVAAVLAGELALLLHELSHALVARGRGQEVTRIIFHGFRAQTMVAEDLSAPAHEALIALVGPGMNLALAGLAEALRLAIVTQGPVDVFLLTLVLGNAAMAAVSLVPLGGSDGGRALSALRRLRSSGCRSGQGSTRSGRSTPTATSRSNPSRESDRNHRQGVLRAEGRQAR
jgi:Zn-dependent protease